MPRPKITVIGSSNVDFVMQGERLPSLGESVNDCTFFQTFGGKGANQAVAAARAGGDTAFVNAVGNDLYAPVMLDGFRKDGIDLAHVARETDIPSGTALVMVGPNGTNYLTVAPGSNNRVTPDRVRAAEKLVAASDWIVLQMEIPAESIVAALELAAKHQRPVLFNYAPVRLPAVPLTPAVTGLVVNETEAAQLAATPFDAKDIPAVSAIAARLRASGGHSFVVVTLGGAGACVATEAGVSHTPAFRIKSVDTTAAGDTFCGALAVALGEGKPLPEAVRFASAAAALCCAVAGAQPSIPARAAIDQFLATN